MCCLGLFQAVIISCFCFCWVVALALLAVMPRLYVPLLRFFVSKSFLLKIQRGEREPPRSFS